MNDLKHARAYVAPLSGLSLKRQREMCEQAAADAGLDVAIYTADDFGKDMDARAEFLARIRRDEMAIVPRLDVLGMRRKRNGKKRPAHDLTAAVLAMVSKAGLCIEAATGITSEQGEDWQEAIRIAHARNAQSRPLTRSRAKAMRARRAPRGTVYQWTKGDMAHLREAQGRIWRDPKFDNREKARAALHPELRHVSHVTLWRIFEGRVPSMKRRRR